MTAHDIIGGAVWVQALVLMAAMGFAAFEILFKVTGRRRSVQTRRRLSLAACGSIVAALIILPIASPWLAGFNAVDAILAQYLKGNIGGMTATEMQSVVNWPDAMVDGLARNTNWLATGVIAIFAAAFVARAIYLILNVLRIRHAIAGGCTLRQTGRVRIIASPRVTVPFSTRSWGTYLVVLPEAVCHDPDAMRMYLGHELQHVRQGDVDAEVVLALVSPFFVLNPGYWFITGRVRDLAELACDRAYLARARMGARDYSLRLLQIARTHAATPSPAPGAFGVPLIGRTLRWLPRKSMLKARIEAIAADMDRTPSEGRALAVCAALGLMALILFTATTLGASGDWSHERIMLSTVVNLERINELNTLAQRSW